MTVLRQICVFCGASPGASSVYTETAYALGQLFAHQGIGLVFGGGTTGLMGAVARGAAQQGGQVTGFIPRSLVVRELVDQPIGELIQVDTMHERKALMAERADAFIALPGGYGTLDELFEAITWGQLGIHQKPIGLLNVNSFFTPLVAWIDHAVAEGFVRHHHRQLVVVAADAEILLEQLRQYEAPPSLVQWQISKSVL
jgi:uncharacterized protein (TIGR00730 family)